MEWTISKLPVQEYYFLNLNKTAVISRSICESANFKYLLWIHGDLKLFHLSETFM